MIEIVPCPRCKTFELVSFRLEPFGDDNEVAYCQCVRCGLKSPEIIVAKDVPDDDDWIFDEVAVRWNKMIQTFQSRGDFS